MKSPKIIMEGKTPRGTFLEWWRFSGWNERQPMLKNYRTGARIKHIMYYYQDDEISSLSKILSSDMHIAHVKEPKDFASAYDSILSSDSELK